MQFDFSSKQVVITGAAGSLGRAVADAFGDAGAQLALLDIREDILQEIYGQRGAVLIAVDLTDPGSVEAAVEKVVTQLGGIDVLANIAGGFTMGPRVHETELKDWDTMLDLNARSVFLTCRATLPHMLAHDGGKIVNIAARVAVAGKANMAPYSVSKTAVARLTESLAAEYRADNINVNCIMPGTIDTPANRRDMPDADFSNWVPPSALADVVLFLCSDAARAIHGACVPVYGMT